MSPRELRIGNLVFHKDNPLPQKIYAIDLYKAQSEYISELAMMDSFTPIPLTEEWLLRFGFGGYNIDGKEIWKSSPVPDIDLRKTDVGFIFDGWGIFQVQYVHQLQNLYFAITHQELEQK